MTPVEKEDATPIEIQQPTTAADFISWGWKHHVEGKFQEAEADFSRASEIDPTSPEAYYGLGMVYKIVGKKEAAVQAFSKALERLKNDPEPSDPAHATMIRHLAETQIQLVERYSGQEPAP